MRKAILMFIVSIIAYFIYYNIRVSTNGICDYNFIDDQPNRYDNLLQDSVVNNSHLYYSIGNHNGGIYSYTYKKKYRFVIWELREFNAVKFDEIVLIKDAKIKWPTSSAIKASSLGPYPSIDVESKMCIDKIEDISLCIGSGSQISAGIKTNIFKYYFGALQKFSVINESNEEQIIVSYKKSPAINTGIILFKNMSSFFLITITPLGNNTIDKDTWKLFNLVK
jgi:hypothetical protein